MYHFNHAGPGYLRVSVQVPNTDNTLIWQTHAVQKLFLNYTNDPEVISFTQTGGTAGLINLTCVIKPPGRPPPPSYALGATIPYNASIKELIDALNSFFFFSPYQLSGVRTMFDSNGTETNDSSQAFRYVWTVSVALMRLANETRMIITPQFISYSGTQSFVITTIKPHGPLIAGSFGLQIAQYTVGTGLLRYNTMPWELQSSIRAIQGFELV